MQQKVNTGYIQDLVNDFKRNEISKTDIVDIITFAESSWGLNMNQEHMKLFPMQKFILKAFYSLALDDTKKYIPLQDEMNTKTLGWFTEQEMMDYLISTRRTNILQYDVDKPKRNLTLCCGRRASKTNITSIICAYEVYRMIKLRNPQMYFGFPEGNEIDITAVATVDEQASVLFQMIRNRIFGCQFFNGRIDDDTKVSFSLKTDADIEAGRCGSICVYCGGAASKALRGKNNLVVVMDEAAHFVNSGPGSMEQCYAAVTPSVASFVPDGKTIGEGKVIILSSPLSKSGMFWDKYCEAYDYPDDALLFQMYSSMINIKIDQAFLRGEQRKNKDLFRCEYCAEFSDTISCWCSPDSIEKATNKARTENRLKGDPGVAYFMGIDFGGKNDGTSLAICHKEDDSIVLDVADVFYSSSSDVWDSSLPYYKQCNRIFAENDVIPLNKLADLIADLCGKFNVVEGIFDQYNGYGLLELLKERKLNQFEMKVVSQQFNLQTFQITKELINTEKLLLFNHPVLIPELASLEECRNGSSMVIHAPQRLGFHDDISDALARAVYLAYNSKKASSKKMTIGSVLNNGVIPKTSYRTWQLNRARQFGGQEFEYRIRYGVRNKWL